MGAALPESSCVHPGCKSIHGLPSNCASSPVNSPRAIRWLCGFLSSLGRSFVEVRRRFDVPASLKRVDENRRGLAAHLQGLFSSEAIAIVHVCMEIAIWVLVQILCKD